MEFRKNQWRLLVLFLLLVCIYSVWTGYSNGQENLSNQDFIRFHVIANSDSPRDQELKKKVRDELIKKINRELEAEAVALADINAKRVGLDLEQSREYIRSHLDSIEETARGIVAAEGVHYEVKAELGARFVPEKTYGNVVFPAGNYEALNVTIGTGAGQNWWCVLFPPLCLIGAEAPEEMECDPLGTELFLDPRYDDLFKAAQGKEKTALKLEFKTLNYMKKID